MRRFDGDRLVIATHNRGKLEEIAALLSPYGIAVSSNADHGLPEPEEIEDTFVGNARIKAHAAAIATGLPALADDSGIEIAGLGGRPGVRTADWAETPGGRDFGLAMRRAWTELQDVGPDVTKDARFCCTLVLAWPDGHDEVFEGTVEGTLIWPPRGTQGHGYDPMFRPVGRSETFGEMDRWVKNGMSHRADAFAKLIAGCLA